MFLVSGPSLSGYIQTGGICVFKRHGNHAVDELCRRTLDKPLPYVHMIQLMQ
jgi:hypothetical protein